MALASIITRRFEVAWTDPALLDAPNVPRLADFERTRRFAHLGAAIAWSRRKLFHGEVAGDFVEMHAVTSHARADGSVSDRYDEVVEISLEGFRKVDTSRRHTLKIGGQEKKCLLV